MYYIHPIMPNKGRPSPARRVREPVQVYLDPADRDLLEQVASATGLARAEVLRRGLRTLAASTLGGGSDAEAPLGYLIGVLGDDESLPRDLAAEHDHHLAEGDEARRRRSRVD
jgi:hypothetical protein